ncbi:uncharacterized protein Dyak_GE22759 [Drosophila yakuba]|uniref:Ionotropic glutamate receptor C-terminal domain-containing protein n=1 Tax=Drosophila yakuba TaxID=7245 RepID=B4IUE5_DROYA|nr:uncharacterized protein Dyak_GE22759 [Drosophila yakuba]
MATGIELLVAAALCVACPPQNESLPPNLYQLRENGVLSLTTEPPIDVEPTDAGPGAGPSEETLQDITNKNDKLRAMHEWIGGKHLRIATLEDFPLSYTQVLENNTRIGLGVSFQIIDFLKKKFNFTYEVVVPQANIIGSPNDYERSLIEMVNKSEVDLAAAFIPSLSGQRSVVYYSGDGQQTPYSLGHCAWFVYGAVMKQGSTLSPIADSTRLLFATWWIFITILTSFYTANLTAFLTLSKFTLPYNTVNDILTKNKHFVSMRGGGVEYAIRTTNESLSMLNRMIQNNYAVFSEETNDTYNLQNYVEKNGYVFVRDRPAINIMLYQDYLYRKTVSFSDEKVHCPFAMAKEPFLKKIRTFAYPIGSNLSQLFDPELLKLVESGIVKHLSNGDIPSAEICPQDLGGTERQLRNGDLMMTYYIMLAGFATALAVFSTELLFRYINSRHEANKWARHGIGRTPNGQSVAPSRWLRGWRRLNSGHGQLLGASTHGQNVTPPPPYQSIFNGGSHGEPLNRWRRRPLANGNALGNGVLLGGDSEGGVRRLINGRDYMVFRSPNGQSQLVPVRSPSAALFQYSYTE